MAAAPGIRSTLSQSGWRDELLQNQIAVFPANGAGTGGQRNGHTTAPALLGPRRDHKYRALHGDVARAVQGYLALTVLFGLGFLAWSRCPMAARLRWKEVASCLWILPAVPRS